MAQNVVTIVAGAYTEAANAAWFSGTALSATTGTFSGILSGSETRLSGLSYTRTAVPDGSGGWCGGYNLTYSGGIKNDSTGALAGFHCSTTGFKIYTNASAAAGTAAVLQLTVGLTGAATFAGALTSASTKVVPVAFASLPTGAAGMRAFVNNALAPVFGAAVAGGGAVTVPVYYDGAAWNVG